MDAPIARIVNWFETLEPASLDAIDSIYAPDASFADPFNDVRGSASIRAVYAHMFATLDRPRFRVRQVVGSVPAVFLTWDFAIERRAGPLTIHGATLLQLGPDGRIHAHRDYWDAAGELYAKLPGLGALMRWLRRRLAAPAPRLITLRN